MADLRTDEHGTPPDYQVGVHPQALVLTVTGTGTRLLKQTRTTDRIPER